MREITRTLHKTVISSIIRWETVNNQHRGNNKTNEKLLHISASFLT